MAVNRSPFFFSFQVLDSEIIYARDYDYNYFGFKVCIIYYYISLSLIQQIIVQIEEHSLVCLYSTAVYLYKCKGRKVVTRSLTH